MAEIVMTEICPYTEGCLIYENWAEQTGNNKLDIILKSNNYKCIAKIALEDPILEGGISHNKTIKERLSNLSSECSYITLLNFLNEIKK